MNFCEVLRGRFIPPFFDSATREVMELIALEFVRRNKEHTRSVEEIEEELLLEIRDLVKFSSLEKFKEILDEGYLHLQKKLMRSPFSLSYKKREEEVEALLLYASMFLYTRDVIREMVRRDMEDEFIVINFQNAKTKGKVIYEHFSYFEVLWKRERPRPSKLARAYAEIIRTAYCFDFRITKKKLARFLDTDFTYCPSKSD